MYLLANKIIDLRIATRNATMCEKFNKSTLSLKTKVLFVLSKKEQTSPSEIISALTLSKTNVAILTRALLDEGLIEKSISTQDRREVAFSITLDGKNYLSERFVIIERAFKSITTEKEFYLKILQDIDAVLDIFSYLPR